MIGENKTRLKQAEAAANISKDYSDMVRATFSDGSVQDLHITEAHLIAMCMNMTEYPEDMEKDPADANEPYIVEVEFLDSTLTEHITSSLLLQEIEYKKRQMENETA